MKVHYFPHFPERSYCDLVKRVNPDAQAFPGDVWIKYSNRLKLYCYWWPKLVLFGIWVARKSMLSDSPPDVVVVWTHLVLLPILILRSLCRRRRPKVVLLDFILTPRQSNLKATLRKYYYRRLLGATDLVICHTESERRSYPNALNLDPNKFAFVPCWDIDGGLRPTTTKQADYVVSAGKSNRDYQLLFRAARRLPLECRIVCDELVKDRHVPDNVTILSDCYGQDYVDALAGARVVVLPLKNEQVTSGQLVLLASMALRKPIVVTAALGTVDYVDDGETALLVPPGDEDALVRAVEQLLSNEQCAGQLAAAAAEAYARNYSTQAALKTLNDLMLERLQRRPSEPIGKEPALRDHCAQEAG